METNYNIHLSNSLILIGYRNVMINGANINIPLIGYGNYDFNDLFKICKCKATSCNNCDINHRFACGARIMLSCLVNMNIKFIDIYYLQGAAFVDSNDTRCIYTVEKKLYIRYNSTCKNSIK